MGKALVAPIRLSPTNSDRSERKFSVCLPLACRRHTRHVRTRIERADPKNPHSLLHQLGYTALEATDPETGLVALRSNEATHLLISDIGLPGMNGRVLANTARDLRPELKILLMTGYASDASALEALAAGMELITKPFTVEALANRLRKMLGEAAPELRRISHDPMA